MLSRWTLLRDSVYVHLSVVRWSTVERRLKLLFGSGSCQLGEVFIIFQLVRIKLHDNAGKRILIFFEFVEDTRVILSQDSTQQWSHSLLLTIFCGLSFRCIHVSPNREDVPARAAARTRIISKKSGPSEIRKTRHSRNWFQIVSSRLTLSHLFVI